MKKPPQKQRLHDEVVVGLEEAVVESVENQIEEAAKQYIEKQSRPPMFGYVDRRDELVHFFLWV